MAAVVATLEYFQARFPEFQSVPETMIAAALVRAADEVDPLMWGALADQGSALLAAHFLAISPSGMGARLQSKDGTTTYKTQFDELRGQATTGYRVF